MSISDEHSSTSNYLCHNCGTINTNVTRCTQCQSEFLEEIPIQTSNTTAQQQLSNENEDQQTSVNQEFQNLFNNNFDVQTFTNMLLPMLMSQIQPDHSQYRHRRGRPPRRIKRITHQSPGHRYLPFLDLSPLQTMNTSTSQIQLLNINESVPGQVLNTQFQPNMALIQLPLQLFVFDQNRELINSEMLTQFLEEDNNILPMTREDINQLPTLTMTESNLSVNPSCAICLENFNQLSDVKQLPMCHHIFHTNCLTEWLLRHGNCPMCRTGISSIQRTPISISNDQWIEQLFFRTLGQQQTNTIVPYVPVKTINSPQIQSNPTTTDQSSSDTSQLPRFDSSSNRE